MISVRSDGARYDVIRRWRVPILPWVILLGLAPWSVWIFSWVPRDAQMFQGAGLFRRGVPLIVALLVLVALCYWAVAHLVNRTRFRIETGTLGVQHGPLPWPGNLTMRLDDITDFAAQTRTIRTKNGWIERSTVYAIVRDGTGRALLEDLREESEAKELAAHLKRHLDELRSRVRRTPAARHG